LLIGKARNPISGFLTPEKMRQILKKKGVAE